jgi:hypothetical protein
MGAKFRFSNFNLNEVVMTNNKRKKDVYTVGIHADGCLYLHPCFSSNHRQAFEMAVANHEQAWGPLPSDFRCLVDGPCHESNCDCGVPCIMEVIKSSGNYHLGLMN